MLETLQPTMKLNRRDSVVVALTPIPKQTQLTIDQQTITTLEDIPQGHKIALGDLKAGDNVIKYGYPIGHVTTDVTAGQWLHTHNVKPIFLVNWIIDMKRCPSKSLPFENRTFQGYLRKMEK